MTFKVFVEALPPGLEVRLCRALNLARCSALVSSEGGASAANFREAIQTTKAALGSWVDLFSISHAPTLGGFLAVQITPDSPILDIGFDVEEISRVRRPVIERVCADPCELTIAPSGAALWCAKEAAFKSFRGPHQPQVISEIFIHEWRHESQFETFIGEYRHSLVRLKSVGFTFSKETHQFAVAFGFDENSKLLSHFDLTFV